MRCSSVYYLLITKGNGFVHKTDEVIGRQIVKTAQSYQIFNLQFRAACFDVVVSLLAFVQQFPDFCLGQIPIFPDVPDALSVIHGILPIALIKESYHTHILSIDNYSQIE